MLFHKVKFWVRKALFIYFEVPTSTKSLRASYEAVRYGIAEKTTRLFKLKICLVVATSGNSPMDGDVHGDEWVLDGRDQGKTGLSCASKKKKAVTAVHLTQDGKVKRMYAMRIEDFSAESLQYILINHISQEAQVTTH
jgi:hypothetical protein